MQIRDVEKLSGLPAKTIRYYEQQGLIDVARNSENNYRDYDEQNVRELRKIKIFRYLDFSLKEIQELFTQDKEVVKKAIEEKAESYQSNLEAIDLKRRVAWKLYDSYSENNAYIEEVDEDIQFLESSEFEELQNIIGEEKIYSVWTSLILSLCAFVFSLPLFLGHMDGNYDHFFLKLAGFAMTVGVILFVWISYFRNLKLHKATVKQKNQKEWVLLPFALIFFLVYGYLAWGVENLGNLFLPEGWLFKESHPLSTTLIPYLVLAPLMLIFDEIRRIILKEKSSLLDQSKRKTYAIGLATWLILICLTAMNFTSVSEDEIRIHKPWQPFGKSYSLEEIESVQTGFGDQDMALFNKYKKKGNFYYLVKVDGRDCVFSTPYTNEKVEKYAEESYLELEDFDQKLMSLGIPKESSEEHLEDNPLDPKYKERFLRIIQNKE